jgi:SNF2 family DNA or RNA helicase
LNYDILPDFLLKTKPSGKKTDSGKDILEPDIPKEFQQKLSNVTLILDEVHMAKNYSSKRGQKVESLSKLCKRVYGLTGTPLLNRPQEFFRVFQVLQTFPFGAWKTFLKVFNGYKNKFNGYEWGEPQPEAAERAARVMLRRKKKEVLQDLPDKFYKNITVSVDGKVKKEIESLFMNMDESCDFSDSFFEDYFEKIDVEALPTFSSFSRIRAKLAESRIPAMLEIVEEYERSETPLVVFSAHRAPVLKLADREGWAVIHGDVPAKKRRDIVADFQAGKYKGVALTIDTGGLGVTLTYASDVLFVDLDWVPANNSQAEDRVHRIKQKNSVLIMRMNSDHVLDRHIQMLLDKKSKLAYKAIDNTLQFKKPRALEAQELIDETDEELAARIEAADKEVAREIVTRKLLNIIGRESAKVDNVPEPALTAKRKALLREALGYMSERCDGAVLKDGQGFNKADSFIAKWIEAIGPEDDDLLAFRVLERILVRYSRQLSDFQAIWKPELG